MAHSAITPENIDKLRPLKAVFRSDLQVSRQCHRAQPVYVIHDPVSHQTHRLDTSQYAIVVALNGQSSLAEAFQRLVGRGVLSESLESHFYQLVLNLYQVGLIVLPIHQGTKLYQQFQKTEKLKGQRKLLSLLFWRIPISNPDSFLQRTQHLFRIFFVSWFAVVWSIAAILAIFVVIRRFDEFAAPLSGVLAPSNLPLLWSLFVCLKLWHELGHGYACKCFGGKVPEMGVILVAGSPLAYVDATSTWNFPERWKRLVVMLGGMYFESLIAIPAVFVWAIAEHGVVASIAFQLVITATVVTLLFNANPLMKFDGYFMLSEVLRLPNLRNRADIQVKRLLKQCFLWIHVGPTETLGTRTLLIAYGLASAAYRASLVLSISWLVATRFPAVGLVIAIYYAGSSLIGTAVNIARYLLHHPETSSITLRASTALMLLFVGFPIAFFVCPVPFAVVTWGVVGAEHEHYIRVATPGEFVGVDVQPGQHVGLGQTVTTLQNRELDEQLVVAQARASEAALKWRAAHEFDVVESARIATVLSTRSRELQESQRDWDELRIVSPARGRVLKVQSSSPGTFLRVGELAALVGDGKPVIRVWLTQDQLNDISKADKRVKFRMAGCSEHTFIGTLVSIQPAAESIFTEHALTHLAGGDLVVDPQTNRPIDTLFQVEIVPDRLDVLTLNHHGRRVATAFAREYESMGAWTARTCLRLLQQLLLT